MILTPNERAVKRLDNPAAVASRLRWLAEQLMTEGRRSDQKSARPNLYRAATQLQYVAKTPSMCFEGADATEFIKAAERVLTIAILERTNLGSIN